jgi:hypothetical protein
MNAATSSTAPAANGTPVSLVEYVRAQPPEEKQAVFLALLREALQLNGDRGLLPIDDEQGKSFGYYVPPKVAAEQLRVLVPVLTPEQEEITRRALADLSKTFDINQFFEELRQEDAGPG